MKTMIKINCTADTILDGFDDFRNGEISWKQFEDIVIEVTQEQDTLLSRGLRKSLEDLDYTHKNIRMERILNTLFEKLDYINIDELETFIEEL